MCREDGKTGSFLEKIIQTGISVLPAMIQTLPGNFSSQLYVQII
jgi:hypothetical protein